MAALFRPVRIVPPYPITYRFKVKSEFEGKSLLDLMLSRFPFHGVNVWKTKINKGHVGVNGEAAEAKHILSRHDEVYHHNPHVIEPSVPDEVQVLEQADDYLIVYKPAPLPMHPGGRYNKNSLTTILEEKGFKNLRIVHRLDAVTSGLVLFARNKSFAQQAMICFSESKVQKTYYALVSGNPEENAITIDTPVRRKTGFVFESELGLKHAKEAITHFEVFKCNQDSAIVKCMPKTGRTHQIRLHLEQWGHPIIDDPIYGLNGDKSSKRAQKAGISLLNAGLEIEELGVKRELEFPVGWSK
ncbi:MAG: RNA pseudouridine synthase [Gracilimonas sp.]|uniref:pseudouridine synthase family protein n=1 Tax=Gracilimonas TaxID=649462 RepID=UPI001B1553E4|nr:RNA pseudouridine synthase [Gracilimonas sp.]MBO6584674.1 RNA pseudouridine synthase [Gracilimonas sp.]MBO6616055.1 RNA pseudouridine synthase [Gracilimonas sp.]